jgi:hypothetical protein
VNKTKLEVREPWEAHCKRRKMTKAGLLRSCTNRELGDRLGIPRNGILQKFARKNETNSHLDLP